MANKAYKKPYDELRKAVEAFLKNPTDAKALEELRKSVAPVVPKVV